MKAWKYLTGLGLLSVLLVAPSSDAKTMKLSPLLEPESCVKQCASKNLQPILGGHWKGNPNSPFYVCAGKTPEDLRPGYQLLGKYDNKCIVGWDSKEYHSPKMVCACE